MISVSSATKNTLGLCLLQPALRAPNETPLEAAHRTIALADRAFVESNTASESSPPTQSNGIDLVLLPELCPLGYSEDTFANHLPTTREKRRVLQDIDEAFRDAAVRWKAAVCYGTIGWKPKENDNSNNNDEANEDETGSTHDTDNNNANPDCEYFIRQKVIDHAGATIASYDKIHLCDYGDCAETRFFTPGAKAVSCSLLGESWKIGIIVCADMRYPLLSRALVRDHGVDVILQPACFFRDVSFRTWTSFRETRAVENGVYFVAGNYAGTNYGEAAVVPPWVDEDHEPLVLGNDEGYLVTTLQKEALERARSDLPFHKHVTGSSSFDTA